MEARFWEKDRGKKEENNIKRKIWNGGKLGLKNKFITNRKVRNNWVGAL